MGGFDSSMKYCLFESQSLYNNDSQRYKSLNCGTPFQKFFFQVEELVNQAKLASTISVKFVQIGLNLRGIPHPTLNLWPHQRRIKRCKSCFHSKSITTRRTSEKGLTVGLLYSEGNRVSHAPLIVKHDRYCNQATRFALMARSV